MREIITNLKETRQAWAELFASIRGNLAERKADKEHAKQLTELKASIASKQDSAHGSYKKGHSVSPWQS